MAVRIGIRILAADNNVRGDLFARLMSDLFLSLGYDNVRLNIARSGREIDIEAEHRLERRRAIAECKALDVKVGGKDVNTFAGKLRPERGRRPRSAVTPYFISLSGFTETSIDQEAEAGEDAVILLGGERVIAELVQGRILAPFERATEQAGRCAANVSGLALDAEADLLAHERGWIWAVYYATNGERSHVVLIHADGTPLTSRMAAEVVAADAVAGGFLNTLACLNPELVIAPSATDQANMALSRYYEYLSAECGYIFLDGLPADAEVGTLRLRLENLFVPLHLVFTSTEPMRRRESRTGRSGRAAATSSPSFQMSLPLGPSWAQFRSMYDLPPPPERTRPRSRRVRVGTVLASRRRIAVLGSPGAGKSTLLRRLAVAYADPSRRRLADDGLPDHDWIPLLFRCRELRDRARAPFGELLDALAARAFMDDHASAFRSRIDRALRAGDVLLLIDGLDEIADAGDRAVFVRNLRTLLAIYPDVGLVVTSREAGFRHVASLLAAVCFQTQLSEFSREDIQHLTVAWHHEVVGQRPEVTAEAERLAATISGNDRIRRLAVNPLLLTTLLLVKRWVGQLPTRRSVLYGKAVEVLLMTWNVEAHEPIDQDEALPQLCYVASAMMQGGVQKITRTELIRLLGEARQQLSAELAFARIGVTEFVERVEHRSSLLMMTGVDIVDGTLVEFYEFRHLTFQEYLTAKAIVEGWYRQRRETDTVASILAPHFHEEKWREVIPLAAVLAGRKAESLIVALSEEARKHGYSVYWILATCLADEVQATPEAIRRALAVLLTKPGWLVQSVQVPSHLLRSRYGVLFREEVGRAFVNAPTMSLGILLGAAVAAQAADTDAGRGTVGEEILRLLNSANVVSRCEGALAIYRVAPEMKDWDRDLSNALASLLSGSLPEQFAASLAFARSRGWGWASTFADLRNEFEQLLKVWHEATGNEINTAAAFALARLPILPRSVDATDVAIPAGIDEFLRKAVAGALESRAAGFVVAYYLRTPFGDSELVSLLEKFGVPKAPWRSKLRRIHAALTQADAQEQESQSGKPEPPSSAPAST